MQAPERSYIVLSQAWYAAANPMEPGVVEEITFGLNFEGGGTAGEMQMRWIDLGNSIAPRLECFSDAFAALASFKDLIDALADKAGITPQGFCGLLAAHGFKDATPRVRPSVL